MTLTNCHKSPKSTHGAAADMCFLGVHGGLSCQAWTSGPAEGNKLPRLPPPPCPPPSTRHPYPSRVALAWKAEEAEMLARSQMSQAGRRATGWHPPSGFPRGGNTEGRGLHEHADRCSEVGRLFPWSQETLPPSSAHTGSCPGAGPTEESDRSREGTRWWTRSRRNEHFSKKASLGTFRRNEWNNWCMAYFEKKKKKVEAAGCAILSAIFSVAHLAASSWALHGPDPF